MNILLVEDNPADARLVREALADSALDVQLHWVATGEGALAWLRGSAGEDGAAQRPDLVLLDLNLPGLRGQEVLAAIKRDPALLSTPVVVLSSSTARRDVLDAYGAHANAYVVKPDDYSDFVALLGTLHRHWAQTVLLPGRAG